jgi:hypothetical protein
MGYLADVCGDRTRIRLGGHVEKRTQCTAASCIAASSRPTIGRHSERPNGEACILCCWNGSTYMGVESVCTALTHQLAGASHIALVYLHLFIHC